MDSGVKQVFERLGQIDEAKSGPWFHCTSENNAQSILQNGFKGGYLPRSQFGEHPNDLLKILREFALWDDQERVEEIENMRPRDAIGQEWQAFIDELMNEWNKHYGDWHYIWVAGDPLKAFGESCLKVRLPDDAIEVAPDNRGGFLFMTENRLEPERFERLNQP